MRSGSFWLFTTLFIAHCGRSPGHPKPADAAASNDVASSDAGVDDMIDATTDDTSSDDASVASDADSSMGDDGFASNDADASSTDGAGAGPCGSRTGMRSLTMRSLTVLGLNRTYLVYLPASLDPQKPVPFVFVFHGFSMNGQEMYDITQYAALADSEGFGVAFPDGQPGSPWDIGSASQIVCGAGNNLNARNPVDFRFIDAMKADIALDQCLDPAHLFATGFSMGGYFTHHVACLRSDFRGAAPHSGGTLADLSSCTTGHVPIIIFHGTNDGLIDDGCDDPNATPVSGFPPSATLWAQRNGCQNTYTTVTEDSDAGGTGQCYLYNGCPADGQVELCTFNGMPHAWAGGSATGQAASAAAPSYVSATHLQWSFFKKYAW
jgi:polyhydroxybutyrate depolymerase